MLKYVTHYIVLAIDFERILSMIQQQQLQNLLKSFSTIFISFYQFRALPSSTFVYISKHSILGLKQYLLDKNRKLNISVLSNFALQKKENKRYMEWTCFCYRMQSKKKKQKQRIEDESWDNNRWIYLVPTNYEWIKKIEK